MLASAFNHQKGISSSLTANTCAFIAEYLGFSVNNIENNSYYNSKGFFTG